MLMRRLSSLVAVILVASSCAKRPEGAGRLLSIDLPHEVTTLDPHSKNLLGPLGVAAQFYESLVTTDADMKLKPCLATRWETPDSTTWIFHLRPEVTFHDGRPLRAEDVVYSLERVKDNPDLGIAVYAIYIVEVTAIDPLTVRIRTSRPVSILLNKLRYVAIVAEGSTAEQLATHVNGTGPYTLAGWRQGESVRLKRNERYWGPRPAWAEVEFHLGKTPEESAGDLLAGRAQLVQCNSRSLAPRITAAGFDLVRRASYFVKYLSFDVAREVTPGIRVGPNPFRNSLVREAVNLAIDRKALVDHLPVDALPATQMVPSTIFGFNPSLELPKHDPDRARLLLRRAGFASGFSARLDLRRIFAEAAGLIRDELQEVGIHVELNVLSDASFSSLLRTEGSSIFLSRYGCATGDASDVLDNLFHTRDLKRHLGAVNFSGYSNPTIDQTIEQSDEIEAVRGRKEVLEGLLDLLAKELVWIPLYTDGDVYGVERRLSWRPRNDSLVFAAEISEK